MNLTIFALHAAYTAMSPLYIGQKNIRIQNARFSHFISPLLVNNYGKISQSVFTKGLSSALILERKTFNESTSYEIPESESLTVSDTAFLNIAGNGNDVVRIVGGYNIAFNNNFMFNCTNAARDSDDSFVVFISNVKNSCQVQNFCQDSCYSSSWANHLDNVKKAEISFCTFMNTSYEKCSASICVSTGSYTMKNINITSANLLLNVFEVDDDTQCSFTYFNALKSYTTRFCYIHSDSKTSISVSQFLNNSCDEAFFFSESLFTLQLSFFSYNYFETFVSVSFSETPSDTIKIADCQFTSSKEEITKLYEEEIANQKYIVFSNNSYSYSYVPTINVEFLNSANCAGFSFPTGDEDSILSKYSSEELIGIILIAIGIVYTLGQLLIFLMRYSGDVKHLDRDLEVEDEDIDELDEDDDESSMVKHRKHRKK
ncbi:hypothetical protein TRFO_00971 [Tritrichomonas foetus]|uniref:Uncharacterized protein n=1 Tax=Tritrichomonas foetus TaxID=1144522 RepID=A0A1J4L2C8_9EUKA|nr:hypothetical protein TRFO_00971 [Tritrichomonas foetus]|eukprot:OHT17671.1 hypothetical protein TRFO_00971 [Tritrichomonas foetus]